MKQIAPDVEILDISSDEEPGFAEDDYDWLSRLLEGGDDSKGNPKVEKPPENNLSSDDDDEVVVVKEFNPRSLMKKESKSITNSVNLDDDDDGDCVVLEDDPDKPKAVINNDDDDDGDDLVVLSQKGEIACKDYPHPRHHCAQFTFSSTPHERHCEQCHCYVCDSLAPCAYWGNTGISTVDHCHATDKEELWEIKRRHLKDGALQVSKRPHVPSGIVLAHKSGLVAAIPQNQISRPTAILQNQISRPTAISKNQISTRTAMSQNRTAISQNRTAISKIQMPRPITISQNQIPRLVATSQNHTSRSTIIQPCSSMTKQNGSQHHTVSLGVRNHVIQKDRVDISVKRPGFVKPTNLPPNQSAYGSNNSDHRYGLQYSRNLGTSSSSGWLGDSSSNLFQSSLPNIGGGVEPRFLGQPVPRPNNIPILPLRNPDEIFADPAYTYIGLLDNHNKSIQQAGNFQLEDMVPMPSSHDTEFENWLVENHSHPDGSELNNVLSPGIGSFDPDFSFI